AGMTIDAATGAFSWTPAEDQDGAHSVTITVTDDGAGLLSVSETFTITVNEINVAPVLDAIGNQSVDEGSTLTFTASATDSDIPANTLTYSLDATSVAAGMTIDAATGAFSWTPAEDQDGAHSVTITVTDDGAGLLNDSETFTITVNEINNNDPFATDDSITVVEGGTSTILDSGQASVLANDGDADLPSDTLTVSVGVGPGHGSLILMADGTFSYIHDDSENFSDSFTYFVSDADGGVTATGTVSITINPVNDNTGSDPDPGGDGTDPGTDPGDDGSGGTEPDLPPDPDPVDDPPPDDSGNEPDPIDDPPPEDSGSEPDPDELADPSEEEGNDPIPVAEAEEPPGVEDLLAEPEPEITEAVRVSDTPESVEQLLDRVARETAAEEGAEQYLGYVAMEATGDGQGSVQQDGEIRTWILKQRYANYHLKAIQATFKQLSDFIIAPAHAAPIYMGPVQLDAIVESRVVREGLQEMRDDIDESYEEAAANQKTVVYAASGLSASFAAGFVSYLLRAGSLMSSFLATMPVWNNFDPVAILTRPKEDKKRTEGEPEDDTTAEYTAEEMFR
ncbi:MAG: tandem-95 repeat protein, partial [Desulfofustis sp.]|nr:tandem-95 repeat protein [Desulfofustis sp.]